MLDLSRLDRGEVEAAAFRTDLREATHDCGFFYLTGHGVPAALIDRVMQTSRAFFDLPEDEKMSIENLKSPHFRGYTRIGGELTPGRVDWREQIDIGPERPDAVKSTVHRVISPLIGDDRVSIPFFFGPALDATIPLLTLPAELETPGITTDPDNPIFTPYGENALKGRLRAHPVVAAIHYADLVK